MEETPHTTRPTAGRDVIGDVTRDNGGVDRVRHEPLSARALHALSASGIGREKGVRGVNGACPPVDNGHSRPLLSPKEIARELASRTLTWCGARSVVSIPPSSAAREAHMPSSGHVHVLRLRAIRDGSQHRHGAHDFMPVFRPAPTRCQPLPPRTTATTRRVRREGARRTRSCRARTVETTVTTRQVREEPRAPNTVSSARTVRRVHAGRSASR